MEIARCLIIPHGESTLNLMMVNDGRADGDARYVLRWIERHGRREFTKRDAQPDGRRRFPKAEDIDAALSELAKRGYVRLRPAETTGAGRPPSPTYDVNPACYENGLPRKRAHNPQKATGEGLNGSSEDNEDVLAEPENATSIETGEGENPQGPGNMEDTRPKPDSIDNDDDGGLLI